MLRGYYFTHWSTLRVPPAVTRLTVYRWVLSTAADTNMGGPAEKNGWKAKRMFFFKADRSLTLHLFVHS